jgi:hypothetical protein
MSARVTLDKIHARLALFRSRVGGHTSKLVKLTMGICNLFKATTDEKIVKQIISSKEMMLSSLLAWLLKSMEHN